MATLVIRHVEDAVHLRLKELAAEHGRSMEEEVRVILNERLANELLPASLGFGQAVRALFEPLGGLELPELPWEPARDPPDFSGPEWDPEA